MKTIIATYGGPTTTPEISNDGRPGGSGKRLPLEALLLSSSAKTSRNVPRPSVATMPSTVGAPLSRRMMPASVSAETAAAATSPSGNATQYGRPSWVTERADDGRAEDADRAVREVDELAGPVDQHQADGEQAVGEPGERPDEQPADGQVEAATSADARVCTAPCRAALTTRPWPGRRRARPG